MLWQNRQSTKLYVVHHNTLSDSFRIWIVWFQPKQDSDQIRISFFKNRIGSDSEKSLSDHLWFGYPYLIRLSFFEIPSDPLSSEIYDTCEISDLLIFLSYFPSQNKEIVAQHHQRGCDKIKSGNYFCDVCCVN